MGVHLITTATNITQHNSIVAYEGLLLSDVLEGGIDMNLTMDWTIRKEREKGITWREESDHRVGSGIGLWIQTKKN